MWHAQSRAFARVRREVAGEQQGRGFVVAGAGGVARGSIEHRSLWTDRPASVAKVSRFTDGWPTGG